MMALVPAIEVYKKRWATDDDPANEFLDSIESAQKRAAAILAHSRQQNLGRQQKQASMPAP